MHMAMDMGSEREPIRLMPPQTTMPRQIVNSAPETSQGVPKALSITEAMEFV